jgi:4'-phosphopantetheinyl transferase
MIIKPLPISKTQTDNKIEIWYGFFNDFTDKVELFRTLLSVQEHERLNKFVFESDKLMYTVSHGVLRIILGKKINQPPENIAFHQNSFEKPIIETPECHFNLSHTRNFFCIAYSNKCTVGIDTEHFKRSIDWQSIAKLYFSENEINEIYKAELNNQLKTFIAIWTRKEAILKALGCGMVNNLKYIDSASDTFVADDSFLKEIQIQEKFNTYYLQTFEVNDMIVSVSFPFKFTIDAKKLDANTL